MIELKIGDCRDVLKTLPDNSIDIIFTSPPFKDEDVEGDYWTFYDEFFQEAYRVASKALIIIHSATKMNEYIRRYPPKRTMVWGKGIIASAWRFNPIYIYQKNEEYKINKYIWCDCFGVEPIKGNVKVHKYQDPLLLYKTILSMFKDCTSFCDPFAGSGTTLKAVEELEHFTGQKLYCLGIEKNPEYESLILERNNQSLATFQEVL
jgi:DNA modification methylase